MSISSDASKPSSANSRLFRFFERPVFVAIREALPRAFVGLLAGLVLFIWFVPVPAGAPLLQQLAARWSGSLLPALSLMGAALVVLLALRLAALMELSPVAYVATCVAAFALALPQPYAGPWIAYLRIAGGTGLFLAIVICLALAAAFKYLRAPVAIALALAAFGGMWVAHAPLADLLYASLKPLGDLGDTYVALMVVVVVQSVLWLVGIHGPAVLAAIVTPVYITLQSQNGDAFAHHLPVPHIVVVSLFLFVFPGGAGSTLPLALLLAVSRVPRLRTIGRAIVVPSFFNLNEPLLYGLPVAYNGFLAVPFVLAPAVLATVTYFAVAWGWVARPIAYVPSSIPTLLSTYLATSFDPRAVLLVLANVAIAGAIYLPFVRKYESFETLRSSG